MQDEALPTPKYTVTADSAADQAGLPSATCVTVHAGGRGSGDTYGDSVIILLVAVLGAFGFAAVMVIALSRAASLADARTAVLSAEERSVQSRTILHQSYDGLADAQSTIARDQSITVPSSRTSAGTQRLPVSSFTSRRTRVWLNIPGSTPRP